MTLSIARETVYRLIFLCLTLVALTSASAHAQTDVNEEARLLFDAGVGASAAERWVQARGYFKSSLALSNKSATLLNLAVVEVKLGLGHDALNTLDAFDRLADPITHAAMIERARALRKLAEQAASQEVARGQEPTVLPATPAITVGSPAPPSVTTGADEPASGSINQASTPGAPTPDRSTRPDTSQRLPRIMLAGGGLLSAVAIASAIAWKARANKLQECRTNVPACENGAIIERERNLTLGIGLASGAAGLGVLTAGVVLLLREKRNRKNSTMQVSWSGRALHLSGRF